MLENIMFYHLVNSPLRKWQIHDLSLVTGSRSSRAFTDHFYKTPSWTRPLPDL